MTVISPTKEDYRGALAIILVALTFSLVFVMAIYHYSIQDIAIILAIFVPLATMVVTFYFNIKEATK